ncbi:MAG TPA: phenylalanine--tRNA ligase subunit beta [Solirubrobacteraceae bacterium]|jgi:phenylalanyl-tRNA synthetase beta chain|nr:phenylalanine--tRNA ligase subunit beta [Solirubrobacteraceae bacterium]
MRVPLPWLREYCDPDMDVQGIEQRLTMTGTKVEAIHHHGVPSAEHFVIGRVLSAEQHPDADRLRVCSVELGLPDGPATIVCGAPNVAAGQTVAVARPGATMPDGTKLGKAKLRGVVSEGMILAESELDIDLNPPTRAGIMVLDGELAPGTPLQDVVAISTEVLELEITPNRPDCLGVYGVARELHAATGAALAPAPWSDDPGSPGPLAASGGGAPATVEVLCPELCPRFTARVFEGVAVAPSPPWLKARLSAAGQRPINNVVDITNYAMLLTGQPLHAFDLDRVAGARLTVRRAADGEQVQTLDGQTRTLDGEMVVIDDAEGPTSIAGLMGGARSEVGEGTTRVLLEVANWHGPTIHRASWALGLRSEASGRFEKGLAPEQCMHAQAVASQLIVELCGATLLPGTIDLGAGGAWVPLAPLAIRLRERRVRAILGVAVAVERQAEILEALDFAPARSEDGLDVTVPALRREDVTREVDLIEEVARIDGLERLPATLPARRGAAGRLTHAQRVRRAAEDALVGRGLHEIVGWSFTDPQLLDRLLIPPEHALRNVVMLANPLSDSQSMMRPTLLGSLLDAAGHNVSRGRPDIAIFESGTVYRAAAGDRPADTSPTDRPAADQRPADEHHGLGVLLSGHTAPRAWRGERAPADFFAAKALLAGLLDRFHVRWSAVPADWPFLHPGRSAAVLAAAPESSGHPGDAAAPAGPAPGGGAAVGSAQDDGASDERTMAETGMLAEGERLPASVGFLGELHPLVAGAWGLERTAAFAIDLGELAAMAPETIAFQPFGAFPALRQDLAVTLPESVSAAELLALVRRGGGEMLEEAEVFDVYTGAQVGEGRRSLALALSFRALERTLTDEDVAPARARIVAALQEIGGELRG